MDMREATGSPQLETEVLKGKGTPWIFHKTHLRNVLTAFGSEAVEGPGERKILSTWGHLSILSFPCTKHGQKTEGAQ